MNVTPSDSESSRFGLRVGRVVLDGTGEVSAMPDDAYDVVIVRHPAHRTDLAAALATQDGYVAIHADTLVYWAWKPHGLDPPTLRPFESRRRIEPDADAIGDLVRDVFAGYRNHYSANPLFDRDDALDGYVEWATDLVAAKVATCIVVEDPGGAPLGFGVVDWSSEPPDIRLAGVCRSARGRGWYSELMLHLMDASQQRPADGLQISTQVHNIAVQRVWARLGYSPQSATTTTHLVRRRLLDPR